jgi:hypothetical protein
MPRGVNGRTRAETAAEARWLIDGGLSPELAAASLGMEMSSVAKACRAAGDTDTAEVFAKRRAWLHEHFPRQATRRHSIAA